MVGPWSVRVLYSFLISHTPMKDRGRARKKAGEEGSRIRPYAGPEGKEQHTHEGSGSAAYVS